MTEICKTLGHLDANKYGLLLLTYDFFVCVFMSPLVGGYYKRVKSKFEVKTPKVVFYGLLKVKNSK